ncbi:MAG: hypothetical protein WAO71_09815 [Gallionella sp.]
MRKLISLLMIYLPLAANSAEYDVAHFSNQRFRISIFHDQGHTVVYTKFINGEADLASWEIHEYPFEEECKFKGNVDWPTPSYIICHKNGRTPLAGTTYKLTQYKKPKTAPRSECEPDDQAGIGVRYICIKGCEKPMVPKYLEAFGGMC